MKYNSMCYIFIFQNRNQKKTSNKSFWRIPCGPPCLVGCTLFPSCLVKVPSLRDPSSFTEKWTTLPTQNPINLLQIPFPNLLFSFSIPYFHLIFKYLICNLPQTNIFRCDLMLNERDFLLESILDLSISNKDHPARTIAQFHQEFHWHNTDFFHWNLIPNRQDLCLLRRSIFLNPKID